MNSFTKKAQLLCTVLFVFLNFVAAAQEYNEVFLTGEKLWNNGACKEACTEFKRYIFVVESTGKKAEALQQQQLYSCYGYLSLFYEQQADFELALKYQKTKQNIQCSDEDLLREIKLYKKIAQKEKRPLNNELDIVCYKLLPEYSYQVHAAAYKAELYSFINCNMWDSFEEEYSQFVLEFPEAFTGEQQKVVEAAITGLKQFKPKKPMLAAHLSVVPGLGQLYAGDFGDSLDAFLLDGSLIGLSAYSLCTGGYTEFFLLEMKPALRFYKGNFYNAQKDSYTYNQKKEAKLKEPLLTIFE